MGDIAQHCRLGLFQDSDFARELEDSKSSSGKILCIFGSRTFVPMSCMCKKQTSVSHSSTEPDIISLDVGLRIDSVLALDLWDVVIDVLHSSNTKAPTTQMNSISEGRVKELRETVASTSYVKLRKKGNQNADQQ